MNNNNQHNRNNGRSNQSNRLGDYSKVIQPLSKKYTDYAKLYLPDGLAYKYAVDFKGIENHQLRKILDEVKEAVYQSDNDFENAQKKMYILVAMTAYNKGRMKKLEPLYDFIKNTINEKSITSAKDIYAFDQMFTSIVAYHTSMKKN